MTEIHEFSDARITSVSGAAFDAPAESAAASEPAVWLFVPEFATAVSVVGCPPDADAGLTAARVVPDGGCEFLVDVFATEVRVGASEAEVAAGSTGGAEVTAGGLLAAWVRPTRACRCHKMNTSTRMTTAAATIPHGIPPSLRAR